MNDQTHPQLHEIPIGIDATGMPTALSRRWPH
jgi:hypothetical protein